MLMKMLKIGGDSFLKAGGKKGKQNMPSFQPNSWKVIVIKQMFYPECITIKVIFHIRERKLLVLCSYSI